MCYMHLMVLMFLQLIDSRVAVPLPSMNPEFLPFILSGNTAALALDKVKSIFTVIEPRHEKTNILVSDLVRHKPGCIATEDG